MSISSIQALIVADPFLQLIIAGVVVALLITVIGLFSARARRRSASTAPHTASNDNVRAAQPVSAPARPVAQPVARPVTPVVPAAPNSGAQLGVGRAWADMPGGWQVLRTMAANADLPVHGLFPVDDGVSRTMAGKIIASGSGASWATMPGGWAALAGGAVPTPAPVAPVASVAPVAAPEPVVEQAAPVQVFAAAAAAAAVAKGAGNGTAATTASGTSGNSETASWASMPGGWQALKASGVATNIAKHGDYPLGDGVARTPAGSIVR